MLDQARLKVSEGVKTEVDLRLGDVQALDVPDEQVLVLGELSEADLSLDILLLELESFMRCAIGLSSFIAEAASAVEEAVPDGAVLPQLA